MESEERAEPESSARLKVQKMNWKKIAGNELLKAQSKINTSQQDKIRSLWNTNREKTRDGFSHQKHKDENEVIDPSDEQPQYNYRGKYCKNAFINCPSPLEHENIELPRNTFVEKARSSHSHASDDS